MQTKSSLFCALCVLVGCQHPTKTEPNTSVGAYAQTNEKTAFEKKDQRRTSARCIDPKTFTGMFDHYEARQILNDLKFAVANPVIFDPSYIEYSEFGDPRTVAQIARNIQGDEDLDLFSDRLFDRVLGDRFSDDHAALPSLSVLSEIAEKRSEAKLARELFLEQLPMSLEKSLTVLQLRGRQFSEANFLSYKEAYASWLVLRYLNDVYQRSDYFTEDQKGIWAEKVTTAEPKISASFETDQEYGGWLSIGYLDNYSGWDRDALRQFIVSSVGAQPAHEAQIEVVLPDSQWFRHEAWQWDEQKQHFCKFDYSEMNALVSTMKNNGAFRNERLIIVKDHNAADRFWVEMQ